MTQPGETKSKKYKLLFNVKRKMPFSYITMPSSMKT